MSWFKYNCKFCDETCSIEIFGSHIIDEHFDEMQGKMMIKDGRLHLLSSTKEDEDMLMCTACGFAVKTQVTFDKHLRTKGQEHKKVHLENLQQMKSSNFNGQLQYIDNEINIDGDDDTDPYESMEPAPKRRKIGMPIAPVAAAPVPQRQALPLEERFNTNYTNLYEIYRELYSDNIKLKKEKEDLMRALNEEKKHRQDAIKLLSK